MTTASKRLESKVAVVTGAAQGIGRAYAVALAAAGARVCVSDIVMPEETVAEIERGGASAIGIVADVSDQESLDSMVKQTTTTFGRLDILVNNAGLFGSLKMKPYSDIPIDEWDKVMAVNVRGIWQAITAAVPAMSGGGKIINISSGTAFKGSPYLLHYVTSQGRSNRLDTGDRTRTRSQKYLRQRDRAGFGYERQCSVTFGLAEYCGFNCLKQSLEARLEAR